MLVISAGSVLADQLLWRRIEVLPAPLIGQALKVGEGLTAPLAWISPAGLLQIAECLLAQAAVVPPGPQLQQLVQGIGEVADLERGHGILAPTGCILHAFRRHSFGSCRGFVCLLSPALAALLRFYGSSNSIPIAAVPLTLLGWRLTAFLPRWLCC
jgi:hypothetical protein